MARRGTKRFVSGILFMIIGYLLFGLLPSLAWVFIILGAIFMIVGLSKLQKAEKIIENIEKKIITQQKNPKNYKKKRKNR